jgi:hypothetical protein
VAADLDGGEELVEVDVQEPDGHRWPVWPGGSG